MPAEVQMRLLPSPQPLVERLGAEFFRGAPQAPGVYRMFDEAGELVYVGKAKNLRARLASYRRTHGQSRKTIRLLHTVRRIEWEICSDEAQARRLENEWIRTARPRFNRAGTWPRSARYIRLEPTEAGFRLRVIADPVDHVGPVGPVAPVGPVGQVGQGERGEGDVRDERGERVMTFGAFRGGAAVGVAALARLLWFAWHRGSECAVLPQALVTADTVRDFDAIHPEARDWLPDLRFFFAGDNDAVLGRLIEAIPEPATPFDRTFVARQFETLIDFHRRGPIRNRRLRALLPADHPATLTPEEQSDWLAWLGPETTPPDWRLRPTDPTTTSDCHEPACVPPPC